MLRDILAYTDIPAIVFAEMQAERVRPHQRTDSNIAISQQHPFKERRTGYFPSDRVSGGELITIQHFGRWGGFNGLGSNT